MANGGTLADNIVHFARALRTAGLPLGPARIVDAVRAVQEIGPRRRDDFYWALHAVFVQRPEQRALFHQAFLMFWRDPDLTERMMQLLLPQAPGAPPPPPAAAARRFAEAMSGRNNPDSRPEEQEVEFDAAMTASAEERLQRQDFESMSLDELQAAQAAMRRLRLDLAEVRTRRYRPARRGRIDLRATLQQARHHAGEIVHLVHEQRVTRPPALVVLCDISGSMSRYSRMLLHFVHALALRRERVHTLVFGTRLTNITRLLQQRDVDVALAQVTGGVSDWSGGTRIGATLHDFNRIWSRRLLGQGAVVLLITDGLDRDAGAGLEAEMQRLRRSCRRLIWLNPLLRWDGYEARSRGAQAILPQVDDFRPVHNLASLRDLAEVLSRPAPQRPLQRSAA